MYLGPIVIIISIFLRDKKITTKSLLIAAMFFVVIFALSSVSIHFSPLKDDEFVYDFCSYEYAKTGLVSFPYLECNIIDSNYFVKFSSLIYYLGANSHLALRSMNYAFIFLACSLMSLTFPLDRQKQNQLFLFMLFCPPILYLGLRPAKEALVVFLIALIYYSFSIKKIIPRVLMLVFSITLMRYIRWQFALGAVVSLLAFGFWSFFSKKTKAVQYRLLVISAVFLTLFGIYFYTSLIKKANHVFFKPDNVYKNSRREDGALVYRFMMNRKDQNSLNLINIAVAHAAGILTPHPLRVIKEYQRDGKIHPHIVEEFLYVTSWFYILLPVFVLYLKNYIGTNWRLNLSQAAVPRFELLYAMSIFSMACFSLLFQTPQLFRYKVPLNLFMFSSLIYYFMKDGWGSIRTDITNHRTLVTLYFAGLTLYSIIYLGLG